MLFCHVCHSVCGMGDKGPRCPRSRKRFARPALAVAVVARNKPVLLRRSPAQRRGVVALRVSLGDFRHPRLPAFPINMFPRVGTMATIETNTISEPFRDSQQIIEDSLRALQALQESLRENQVLLTERRALCRQIQAERDEYANAIKRAWARLEAAHQALRPQNTD